MDMEVIDLKKAYKAPQAKVLELGVVSVLCGSPDSPDYVGGTSTEELDEQDISGSIW